MQGFRSVSSLLISRLSPHFTPLTSLSSLSSHLLPSSLFSRTTNNTTPTSFSRTTNNTTPSTTNHQQTQRIINKRTPPTQPPTRKPGEIFLPWANVQAGRSGHGWNVQLGRSPMAKKHSPVNDGKQPRLTAQSQISYLKIRD